MHFEAEFFEMTNNFYLKWMYKNHTIHHLQKGKKKGNFNIIFPGSDVIMGDYRTFVDNSEYCSQAEHMNEHICQNEYY